VSTVKTTALNPKLSARCTNVAETSLFLYTLLGIYTQW
jgi:hypothetical protein